MNSSLAYLSHTPQAVADLDEIWDYIAQDSPQAADRVIDRLGETFHLLASQPSMGQSQPMLADGSYRRFVHEKYIIYYRRTDNGILLLRILHSARRHDDLL